MLPELVMLALLKAWMPVEFPPVAGDGSGIGEVDSVGNDGRRSYPCRRDNPGIGDVGSRGAAMPAFVPVTVPVFVLVTVRVAASKMPKAPPERNTELVQVWLAPAVAH